MSWDTSQTNLGLSAIRRVHNEVVIENAVMADGIRRDGSFDQHSGVLYNGNYGKNYVNDVLESDINAGGTKFSASNTSRDTVATLFDGDEWVIYRNALTGVTHRDLSVLVRFISFPVADNRVTASIEIHVGDVHQLWEETFGFASSLMSPSLEQDEFSAPASVAALLYHKR